jgi:succinoglycan biosynthesis transport protein ExoP
MRESIENALALREPEMMAEPFLSQYPTLPINQDEEPTHLRDYWKAVRKRLWLVAGLAVLVTALATVMMLRRNNVYEATARVQVDLETASPLVSSKNNSVVVSNPVNDPAYFNTQLQILAGPGLLRRAVKALDLEHNSTFVAKMNRRPLWKNLERVVGLDGGAPDQTGIQPANEVPIAATKGNEESEESERLTPLVDALQRDLKIEPVKETRLQTKETRLIEISYTSGDPRLATRIVNTIADTFAAANLEKKTKTGAASGDFLNKRIAELQSQIREGEQKLISYGNSNQILSLDPTQNTVVDRLVGLNKQLLEAENERKLSEATYHAAQAPGAASALAQENAKSIDEAEQRLTELQQKRAQLLVDNTEEWPEVKETNQQIATVERKIDEMKNRAVSVVIINLKTRYEQSLTRENALRAAFNQQRGETLTQNEAAINYHIIQQEIETNKNLLDGLLQRAKENDVAMAGTPNNINVVDYAITPHQPVGPQRLLGVTLAALIAIVFGICLAIFLEYLDNTVRSANDVERMLGLPALATIPSIGGFARRRFFPSMGSGKALKEGAIARPGLLINDHPRSTITEAYKQLRTSILLSTAGRAPKTLLITSAKPEEGKTTTAVNTAVSLAQTGARVLIIDADLRRPMIHHIFNIVNAAGLSTALSRDVTEEDVLALIEFQPESGLHLMPSGPIPPNPSELLGSDQMKQMLQMLAPHFDHIVIDSPPITNVTDGVLLASLVDGVILVVHGGQSTREIVRRSRQLLRGVGARIFGVVLNNVKQRDDDYYYRYYDRKPYGFESTTSVSQVSLAK